MRFVDYLGLERGMPADLGFRPDPRDCGGHDQACSRMDRLKQNYHPLAKDLSGYRITG